MAGEHTLGSLAEQFQLELRGDPATPVAGVCTLAPGKPGCLSFLANPKYRSQLADSAAAAVVVVARDAAAAKMPVLVARDPYLAYARIARLFDGHRQFAKDEIHPSAVIAGSAVIGRGCHIGPHALIEDGAVLGDGVYVGPQCVVGKGARVGAGSQLVARVYLWHGVQLGERCVVQPGAVVGSRGFGNVRGPSGWEEVPQVGSVRIGDDVEIGANTCIDRGAIDDTIIGNGVRLDNLIQIAHNCVIGDHTAMAACTGVAGSSRIGARCMIGGAVGISGHLEIADDVVILGRATVTRSLLQKGVYGSGLVVEPAREWRKTVARVRRLGRLEERVKHVEGRLSIEAQEDGDDDQDEL